MRYDPLSACWGARLMEDGPGKTLYAGKQIVSKAAPLSQPSAVCADTITTISRLPWLAQCSITIEKLHCRFFLRYSISMASMSFNIMASTLLPHIERRKIGKKDANDGSRYDCEQISAALTQNASCQSVASSSLAAMCIAPLSTYSTVSAGVWPPDPPSATPTAGNPAAA